MPRKRHTPEQIISKLREAEVGLAGGHTVPEVCRALGLAEQTYYRWRKEYGGLKVEQARRFKELERDVKPPFYVPLSDRVSGTGGRMFRA